MKGGECRCPRSTNVCHSGLALDGSHVDWQFEQAEARLGCLNRCPESGDQGAVQLEHLGKGQTTNHNTLRPSSRNQPRDGRAEPGRCPELRATTEDRVQRTQRKADWPRQGHCRRRRFHGFERQRDCAWAFGGRGNFRVSRLQERPTAGHRTTTPKRGAARTRTRHFGHHRSPNCEKSCEIVGAQVIATGTLTPFGESVRLTARALDVTVSCGSVARNRTTAKPVVPSLN